MKKVFSVIATISLLILLTACGGSSSGGSSSSAVNDEKETEKWNSYVAVSNSVETLDKILSDYLEIFGDEKTYQKNEKTQAFTNSMSLSGLSAERFTKNIDKAIELSAKSSSDLDKATAKMLVPLKELWTTLLQSYSYHKSKDYVDDNYAKAQTLHEKILAAYPLFYETNAQFNKLMDVRAREIHQNDLKAMKDDGRLIAASMLQSIDAAQNMQSILFEQEITAQNIQDLKMDTFKPAYDEFLKCLDEYEKLIADEKQVKKEKLDDYAVKSVLNGLKQVKASASSMIERYQNKSKASGTSPGTPAHFNQQMDYLITRYNQTIGS